MSLVCKRCESSCKVLHRVQWTHRPHVKETITELESFKLKIRVSAIRFRPRPPSCPDLAATRIRSSRRRFPCKVRVRLNLITSCSRNTPVPALIVANTYVIPANTLLGLQMGKSNLSGGHLLTTSVAGRSRYLVIPADRKKRR